MSILAIILILLLLGAIPWGGYHDYGYSPAGVVILILIILLLAGRL